MVERDGSVFGPDAVRFFVDLEAHNDRAWFTANRRRYDEAVRAPLEALLAEAERRFGPGRIMRPHRDVRFSPDKSPYALGASLVAGAPGGVYLRFDRTGIQAGGGLYEPSRDQLRRARESLAARPAVAGSLRHALGELRDAGYELAGQDLATAPRGWPRDHPAIDLLRMRHYAGTRHLPADADLTHVVEAWQGVRPLLGFAERHVGAAESWP